MLKLLKINFRYHKWILRIFLPYNWHFDDNFSILICIYRLKYFCDYTQISIIWGNQCKFHDFSKSSKTRVYFHDPPDHAWKRVFNHDLADHENKHVFLMVFSDHEIEWNLIWNGKYHHRDKWYTIICPPLGVTESQKQETILIIY